MNEFSAVAEEYFRSGGLTGASSERERRLRNSLSISMGANPDQEAEQVKLSEQSGLPRGYVQRNPDKAREAVTFEGVDVLRLLNESPTAAEFLSDPENAKQANDDIENLSAIENAWRKSVGVGKAILGAPGQYLAAGLSGVNESANALTRMVLRGADAVLPESADDIIYSDVSDLSPGWRTLATATNPFYQAGAASTLINEYNEVFDIDPDQESYVADIAGAVSGTASLALVTALSPTTGGTLLFGMGADEQAERQRDLDVFGENNNTDAAILSGAAFQMVVERLGIERIIDKVPQAVKHRMARKIIDITSTAGVEGFMEGVEAAGQNLIEYAYYNPDAEIFQDVAPNAQLGGIAGGILRGIIIATGAGRRRLASEGDAAKINETMSAIEISRLAGRNRDLARQYLEALGDETGSDTLYVDPEGADVLFQSVNDPAALDTPAMRSILDQVDDAKRNGSKIKIPLADLPELVQNGAARAAQQYMTSDIDALSPAQQADADVQSEIEVLRGMIEQEQSESREVFDEVLGMRLAMGVDQDQAEMDALYWEAFFRTMSRKGGVSESPIEIFRRAAPSMGYEVDPELRAQARRLDRMDATLDMLREGQVPTDQEIFGDSITQFIRKEGGAIDDGGELAARDADNLIRQNTGKTLDELAERAVEEGYLQERNIDDLLALIDADLAGNPAYRSGMENQDLLNTRMDMDQLQQLLDQSGLDLAEMSNDQIREALSIPNANPDDVLTQEDVPVTETEAFKEWFGDSKVVDENGDPLVVYHGTGEDFDVFDMDGITADAAYFAEDPDVANLFAATEDNSRVMPVYIAAKNPMEIDFSSVIDDQGYFLQEEMIAAVDAAKAGGYDSLKIIGVVESQGMTPSDQWAVFSPDQIKSAIGNRGTFDPESPNILEQGDTDENIVRGYFNRTNNRITFTKRANYSTFVHESSHFFLEVMRSYADQSPQIRDELDTIERWAQSQGAQNDTDVHEMFASGFETYSMEGKAPTPELQPIFNRFRIWLTEIYRAITGPFRANNLAGVELSDEVRDVMDRMLATKDEIEIARAEAGMGPRFSQALGLTMEEALEYERMLAEAEEETMRQATSQVMEELSC